MKVLFAGFKYEYGVKQWGISNIEYTNFFGSLKNMENVQASFFPVDEIIAEVGRDEMNRRLIKTAEDGKPDLLFTMIFQEEIKKETVEYITKKTATKTFNWFADDHWRLPVYSRFWAPLYTAVGTTDSKAPEKYRRLGINNVIKTQWAANVFLYKPQSNVKGPSSAEATVGKQLSNVHNITFVGKNYGTREKYIGGLQRCGLAARGYGKGWDGGMVDFQAMLEIFSSSKINLNFTESYFSWPKQLVKLFVKKSGVGYIPNIQSPISNLQSLIGARRRQIKARTFEIPACGGFLLTGDADNLREYYDDGKEIVIFKNKEELEEKCKYYLAHEEERKAIAQAGYQRTLKEHTYELRFREIFKKMELM